MHSFELNKHGKIVFPANCFPDLDFSAFESIEQLDAVQHLAARYAGLAEDFHDLVLGMFAGPFVDGCGQSLDIVRARPGMRLLSRCNGTGYTQMSTMAFYCFSE